MISFTSQFRANIATTTVFYTSTAISVLVVRFVSHVSMSFTAMVSVCQIHSVLQSVSANIVTVLISRCMTIGHARDATAVQTEFDKK